MKRLIIKIDEEKCNGCGLCVPNCAEGAIQIVGGKARLVQERFCDGLGACLGHCPQGALTLEEREADDFDEAAVEEHLHRAAAPVSLPVAGEAGGTALPCGCPGSTARTIARRPAPATPSAAGGAAEPKAAELGAAAGRMPSELGQWPVQLALVSPTASYFKGAGLLVAADCVPFAYAGFHQDFLRGRAVVIGCPKLDDSGYYVEKLSELIRRNDLRSLTVVHMEVPCCFGLSRIVDEALARSGKSLPVDDVTIGIQGEVLRK